jgi:hypothetical protein
MRNESNQQRANRCPKQNNTVMKKASKTVHISKLKDFVAKNYPPESPLQIVLVGEEDVLSVEAFLAKLTIWSKLSRISMRR